MSPPCQPHTRQGKRQDKQEFCLQLISKPWAQITEKYLGLSGFSVVLVDSWCSTNFVRELLSTPLPIIKKIIDTQFQTADIAL